MANILWIQPNNTLSLTSIVIDDVSAENHAKELQERGDIPADWIIAGYDVDFPIEHPQEAYRWNGTNIILDETALAEINAKNAQFTKEQLLSEIQALTARIETLESK